VNFVEAFDPILCAVVLVIACLGKIVGCGGAALAAGMPKREAWALGFGMNARGAMEIILGLLARDAGLIDDRMLVALVLMALVTSMISGPLMEKALARRRPARFLHYLRNRGFVVLGPDQNRWQAITAVAEGLSTATAFPAGVLLDALGRREGLTSGQLAPGVGLAHARLDGLQAPLVGVGLCRDGFAEAAEGPPIQALVVLMTPHGQEETQLEILADLGRTFLNPKLRRAILQTESSTSLRALLQTAHGGG